jgi:hypothetical protein
MPPFGSVGNRQSQIGNRQWLIPLLLTAIK